MGFINGVIFPDRHVPFDKSYFSLILFNLTLDAGKTQQDGPHKVLNLAEDLGYQCSAVATTSPVRLRADHGDELTGAQEPSTHMRKLVGGKRGHAYCL